MKQIKLTFLFLLFIFLTSYFLYQVQPVHAQFGQIPNPLPQYPSVHGEGLFLFLSNIFKLVGTVAGIFMVFQFILAGYDYISASGEPKKTELAWAKIYQSLIGIIIIAGAFALASVVERITGIKILSPTIYGP